MVILSSGQVFGIALLCKYHHGYIASIEVIPLAKTSIGPTTAKYLYQLNARSPRIVSAYLGRSSNVQKTLGT